MCHLKLRAAPGRDAGVSQGLLKGAEHQGQRGAELVADVGEEPRLGAVEFSQRLGASPFLLVGARVTQRRRDLACHEVEEAPVAFVERPARADAEHEHAERVRA